MTVEQYIRFYEPEKDKLWNEWYREELENLLFYKFDNLMKLQYIYELD